MVAGDTGGDVMSEWKNEPNEVEEVKNEFIELDQVDPKELLNTIRKQ